MCNNVRYHFFFLLFSVVVSLCEKNRAIGTSAKNMIMSNLKNTVWGHKRLIGRKFSDPVVQQEKATLPYAVVSGPDDSTAIQVHGTNRPFVTLICAFFIIYFIYAEVPCPKKWYIFCDPMITHLTVFLTFV